MSDISTVAVVGAGAIGAGWTALANHRGYAVLAYDTNPGAEDIFRETVARQREELARVTGSPDDPAPALEFHCDSGGPGGTGEASALAEVAASADLVIECGPERLDVKHELFAVLDEHAAPEVLLTSSTSGLMPSDIQWAARRHPERMLVAHPFNPPHLMPLVEIVGGASTAPEAVERALTVFAALGKRPIHLRRELVGHVANRLQAALWREAYHLVESGAVSVADLDTAIAAGPGLRWALLGPFATQHLSGGPGGIAHMLEHLGGPIEGWWADLGSPTLTPQLRDTLAAGMDAELDDLGLSTADLVRRRDTALTDLLALKAERGL